MVCGAISVGLLMFVLADTMPWIIVAFLLRGGMFASWAMMLAEMGERAPSRLRSRAFAVMEIMGGKVMAPADHCLPSCTESIRRRRFWRAILGGLMTIRRLGPVAEARKRHPTGDRQSLTAACLLPHPAAIRSIEQRKHELMVLDRRFPECVLPSP